MGNLFTMVDPNENTWSTIREVLQLRVKSPDTVEEAIEAGEK
jgi:hypothetical protein